MYLHEIKAQSLRKKANSRPQKNKEHRTDRGRALVSF